MLCRFSTISEWISLCVVILLGLAILSNGEEHTFMHDKLSKERSPCHLRCAKESSEGISLEECVESCQRKLMLSSESNVKHKKRIITKTLIRHQREVGNTNEINECGFSSQASAPHRVEKEKMTINFTAPEGPIYVTWEAPDFSKIDFNWTNYALIYHGEGVVDAHCKVLPKNQTDYLVTQLDNWKYPETFHLAVVTYPYRWDKIVLHDFTPAGHNKDHTIYIPTVSKKDTAKFVSSIVGGLIAGVALLVILYSAVKWKRSRLCPVVDDRRMPPPVPARPENGKYNKERYYCCYYPENEAFRERVASIVNYFRENGYNVIMDRMVSEEITSQGPTRWGENQIRKARKVLIFLSSGLVNLALDGREDLQCQDINRVWIELEVLRDLYTRNRSAAKMVCIALPDVPVTSEALPLWAKVSYKWPEDALEILKRLNDRPMILPV